MTDNMKTTAPKSPVRADEEQSLSNTTNESISDDSAENKNYFNIL